MSDRHLEIMIDNLSMIAIQEDIKSLINEKFINKNLDAVIEKICIESKEIIKNHLSHGAWVALQDFAENKDCLTLCIEKIQLPPINELPSTPVNGFDKEIEMSMRYFDAILLGLMNSAKLTPTANISENQGRLIRNVMARLGHEEVTSSHGSTATLGFHNDQLNYNLSRNKAFSTFPDVLAFMAIKNEEKIDTHIISVDSILDNLCYKSVRLLQHGEYTFQGPKSTVISPYSPRREKEALLAKSGDSFSIRFDPNVVCVSVPQTEYKIALDELVDYLKNAEPDKSYCVKSGDILMLKNRLVLHKRNSFDRFDDDKRSRWLRRVYGVNYI